MHIELWRHRRPYRLHLDPLEPRTMLAAAVADLQLIVPDSYLPGVPVLVEVRALDTAGNVQRELWDATVELDSSRSDITLSDDSVRLYNGVGSVLTTIGGSGTGRFEIKALLNGVERAARGLRDLRGTPQTAVSGALTGTSTEWSGIVRVTGDVTVPDGHTLTVLPGTLVLLDGNPVDNAQDGKQIVVNGAIHSMGTEERPVYFTATNPNAPWGEIEHASAEPSTYNWTMITRAGHSTRGGHTNTGPAIRSNQSTITLDNTFISDLTGKTMMADRSILTFRNSHMARSAMGPEIERSSLLFENSWSTDMSGIYTDSGTINDNDAFYSHRQLQGQQVRFINSVFADIDDDGIDGLSADLIIEDSIIRDIGDKGISVEEGTNFYTNVLIVDTRIGISSKINNNSSYPQISVNNLDNVTIVASRNAIQGEDRYGLPNAKLEFNIRNSILRATTDPIFTAFNPADIRISYSNVGETWPGVGNLNVDPLFVNAAGGNYHLRLNSPSANAGDPASPLGPDGQRTDQGFYKDAVGGIPTGRVLGGTLSSSMTLSPSGGAYYVNRNLTVPVGATLTIQPGTVLYVEDDTELRVLGRLLAQGTGTSSIHFTRIPGTKGDWDGIQFRNTLADNRISHAIIEYADPVDLDGSIGLEDSNLTVENVRFDHINLYRITAEDSSLRVRNSVFAEYFPGNMPPATDNDSEHISVRGILPQGELLIEGNTFGASKGHNDLVDLDPGERPTNPARIINNMFMGGGDDAIDLEGDTYIEGNTFLNLTKDVWNTSEGNANAISAGSGYTYYVGRNTFHNVERIVQVLGGSVLRFDNNTAVNVSGPAIYFPDAEPGTSAAVEGSIFWQSPVVFEGVVAPVTLAVNHSLVPAEWIGAGVGNITGDPMFKNPAGGNFSLLPGSSAIGTGPNGIDMGALVPAGASVSGAPLGLTMRTEATLVVDGPLVTHYRYRLDGGAWSVETPVATPIHLSGLSDGQHTVDVVGRNAAGIWQPFQDAISRSWSVLTKIEATEGDDLIEVSVDKDTGLIAFFINTSAGGFPTFAIAPEEIRPFILSGLGGDDRLVGRIGVVDDPSTPEREIVTFDGGAGTDTHEISVNDDDLVVSLSSAGAAGMKHAGVERFNMNITGGEGGDLHIMEPVPYEVQFRGFNGSGFLNVFGTPGDDTMKLSDSWVTWGPLRASYSTIRGVSIFGGAGDDEFVVTASLPGENAYSLLGEEGRNTLRFTGGQNTFGFEAGSGNSHDLDGNFTLQVVGQAEATLLNLAGASSFATVDLSGGKARLNLIDGVDGATGAIIRGVLRTGSLMAMDGLLNIGTGGLILADMSLDAVRSQIVSGRGSTGGTASGRWNGTSGITSSAAAEVFLAGNKESRSIGYARNGNLLQKFTTFMGEVVGDDDVLVRFTKNGDANLDGLVSNNDVTILAGFYRPGNSGRHWAQGDFNYDSFVDNIDITTLAGFYAPNELPIAVEAAEASATMQTDRKHPARVEPFFAEDKTVLD